jgi:hypothetical protein
MAEVQTSEVDTKLPPVNTGPLKFVFLKTFRGWATLNKTTLREKKKKNTNMAGG